MAASLFSSPAEQAISRTLVVTPDTPVLTTSEDVAHLREIYEIEWTANELRRGGYKQVSLQFPDELLHISVPIFQLLKEQLDANVGLYILADTSYGSCCVDEVAAQHVNADVIVHYGHSCLSRPTRMPVLYVFSKRNVDCRAAAESLLQLYRQEKAAEVPGTTHNFILVPDVSYAHVIDDLNGAIMASPLLPQNTHLFYDKVPKRDDPAQVPLSSTSPMDTSDNTASSSTQNQTVPHMEVTSHRRYTLPSPVLLHACTILYVGPENLGLTNLLMTHPENMVISYDPSSNNACAKVESLRTNRLLMRRYAVVQRARDADVIGILVGTLGVASYLPLLSNIRKTLRAHRKKSYTLSVGKLTPSKLANFPEIECFVLVACPENSLIEAKEFLRPIVTPFELYLSLSSEPLWPGNYILDFDRAIENYVTEQKDATSDAELDRDRPNFSLVTGKYRHAKRFGEGPSEDPSNDFSMVLRNTEGALTRHTESAGAEFLQQRTFKGLEQKLGEDSPSVLEQGRSGIARGYQDDHAEQLISPPPRDAGGM